MLVKRAKSSYGIPDFSRIFVYDDDAYPFAFCRALNLFSEKTSWRWVHVVLFTSFHWLNNRPAKDLHVFFRNLSTSPFITLLTWISQLKGQWRPMLNYSIMHLLIFVTDHYWIFRLCFKALQLLTPALYMHTSVNAYTLVALRLCFKAHQLLTPTLYMHTSCFKALFENWILCDQNILS